MIVGLGLDVCRLDRVEQFIERYGERFLGKICTQDERQEMTRFSHPKSFAEHLAGRIAAKEAASKALGTGWRRGVHWKCFEVGHEPSGRPVLRATGAAATIMSQLGVKNAVVTITHDAGFAAAVVIFEAE